MAVLIVASQQLKIIKNTIITQQKMLVVRLRNQKHLSDLINSLTELLYKFLIQQFHRRMLKSWKLFVREHHLLQWNKMPPSPPAVPEIIKNDHNVFVKAFLNNSPELCKNQTLMF